MTSHPKKSPIVSPIVSPVASRSAFAMEGLESRTLRSATLLNDINAGGASSLPENFNVVNNKVVFTAYDSSHGQTIWTTDGTPAGTKMVADINPDPQNGLYQGYGGGSIVIANEMYFTGADAAYGVELWKTDGTAAGTQLVDDLNPGIDGSYPTGFTNFNGKLAFAAMGQLWVSDGTSAGTISLGTYNPTGVDGTSDRMAVLGNELYFMRYNPADSSGQSTGELWATDGTLAGTHMVTDVSPTNDGDESVSPEPSQLTNVNGTLYFAADDGVHGWELWQSDGTAGGTTMVADLAPPPTTGAPQDGSYPTNLTDVNGDLYFTASPNYAAPQLYRLDPANGQPVLVDPTSSGGPSNPNQLTATSNGLFFTADDGNGNALWHTDGTTAGTVELANINPDGDSEISAISAVGSSVYFSADDGTHGAELWTSNGTQAGTVLAADIEQGSEGSSPGQGIAFDGRLIFAADVDADGEEPFALNLPTPSVVTSQLASPFAAGISNDPMPVVVGKAPAGSIVNLFADGNLIGSATVAAGGDYQVQSSVALDNHLHLLTVVDELNGDSSSSSPVMRFTVDTTHPTADFVSATSTSITLQFSENVAASFTRSDFSVTDIDTGARIPIADVRVSFNSKNNTATITFKGMPGSTLHTGHYRLRIEAVRVTDIAGNDLSSDESFGFTIRKKPK